MTLPRIDPYPPPAESELPESRVSWHADRARAVLLVHDMQQYFVRAFTPAAEPLRSVVPRIARLCDAARAAGVPVLYSVQPGNQAPDERALLRDFWGHGPSDSASDLAIVPDLAPQPGEAPFTKWRYSAFRRTGLGELLLSTGRDQLIITGIYTHIGCLMTAADAFMEDVQPFLVADATADFSRTEHERALEWVAGRCGRVTSTAALERELARASAEN